MNEKKASVELLNFIHQNASMGQDTIEHLLNVVEDVSFRKVLQSFFAEYKKIYNGTDSMIHEYGGEVEEINKMAKISSYMMINMKTLTDKSSSHIAEMLINGSTMGIIQITRKLNEYRDAETNVRRFGEKLLAFEQDNVEACRKFL